MKGKFDASFINETFVIHVYISNRQHTHPVYKYRLPFPFKFSKIFLAKTAVDILFNLDSTIGSV